MLQITEVRCHTGTSAVHAAVDTPEAGWSGRGHAIHLNGWVLDGEGPCTSVEVVYRDTVLRSVELGVRPDIAAIPAFADLAWAARSGFSTGVGTLGLPETFELEVRAVLRGGERRCIASLSGTRTTLAATTPPRLRPLMVTCLGRSGTTLLMELLSGHPSIVVHSQHPYETRGATYWMQMAKVAGEPGPVVAPVSWYDQLSELEVVRPIPFYGQLPTEEMTWMSSEYTQRLADFCISALGDFYQACASFVGKPGATAFAEKQFPGLLADVLREVCPTHAEIVSIRDPRDMLLSILAFLDSGRTVLSHTGGDAPRAIVDRFTAELRLLFERVQRPGSVVVRYEDLVNDQFATLRRALRRTGFSATDAEVRLMQSASAGRREHYEGHRTTESLGDAVGRWRREFEGRLRALWTPELEALTVGLGYPATSAEALTRVA
ncbi:MAG TPA: sulfotransferase [Acidimicrobiales bacterium]|jgi:hypothetical protein|nr:sulfotransferase [Acidimicrobiales bacterium]